MEVREPSREPHRVSAECVEHGRYKSVLKRSRQVHIEMAEKRRAETGLAFSGLAERGTDPAERCGAMKHGLGCILLYRST